MVTRERVDYFLESLKDKTVAVFGDAMIDASFYGKIERPNPEGPEPLVRGTGKDYVLGGAANVAANLRDIGAKVTLYTRLGDDREGDRVADLCAVRGIALQAIRAGETPCKIRVVDKSGRKFLRYDDGESRDAGPLSDSNLGSLVESFRNAPHFDAIACADYNKGVFVGFNGRKLVNNLREYANVAGIPLVVDPKPANSDNFRNVTLIRPNIAEARAITGKTEHNDIREVARQLHKLLEPQHTVVTLGPQGIYLLSGESGVLIPTRAREVADSTGAGDTVIAGLTLGLATGLMIEEACVIANAAAGIVCGKKGTATVTPDELRAAFK